MSVLWLTALALSAPGPTVLTTLSSFGSTEESRAAVEKVLAAELGKLLDEVVTPEQIPDRPELARALATCEGRSECLIQVAADLGLGGVIVGNIAGLGDDRVLNLRYLDPSRTDVPRSTAASISGDAAQLIPAMRAAAVQLVAPDQYVGTVELRVAESGIDIKVDGLSLGRSPLPQSRLRLPVGTHAIEATAPGRVSMSAMVDVHYESDVPVTIALPISDVVVGGRTPFRHRWWTWTLAGVGATALALGAVFNVQQADLAGRLTQGYANGTLTASNRDLYYQEETSWNVALISYVVGAALLSTVGTLLTWDLIAD